MKEKWRVIGNEREGEKGEGEKEREYNTGQCVGVAVTHYLFAVV